MGNHQTKPTQRTEQQNSKQLNNQQTKPIHQNQETNNFNEKEWFHSASDGKIEIVEKYLKSGWDVNMCTIGVTALYLAVDKGHIEIVKLLLEHGADVNARTGVGMRTPLHLAVMFRHIEIVRLLLEHGADVNVTVEERFCIMMRSIVRFYTALYLAVENGHIEIVKLLLEHGADINLKDSVGETALDSAKGDTKMFGFIRQWMEEKEDLDPNT